MIAEHIGHRGPKILLIGHLDTVFDQHDSFQKFTRQGDTATGPGVIDDKGGDIVLLYALKALQTLNLLDGMNITVVLTGDEENSGKPTSISRKPLIEIAKNSDVALEFEWSMGLDTATASRRGISGWTITATGNEAHSSKVFQPKVGYGAIFELCRIMDTMRTQLSGEKYLSFNPGMIMGGNAVEFNQSQIIVRGLENKVAKIAAAQGDFRFIDEEQKNHFEKKLFLIVSQHLPETNAVIHFQDGIPAMPLTANNLALLQQYSQASIDLGYGPVKAIDPMLRGGSDLSHVAKYVPANLGGLGPYGEGAHSVQEILQIKSLPIAIARSALLIERLNR